jgi:hypothetical protein
MTYLTGLALGISAGGKLHQLLGGARFSQVHALPGRRRYQHDDLLNNKELATEWEQHLIRVKGINTVKVNPVTGSILLEYSCQEEYIDLAMNYLNELHKMPGPRDDYGKLGINIRSLCRRMNRNIFRNTGHTLDLRTVLAIIMFVGGTAKIWRLGQRPAGPQMVWWAYSLLKGRC